MSQYGAKKGPTYTTHTHTHRCSLSWMQLLLHFFSAVALRPNAGHGLLILEVSRSHITTHHSRWDYSGRVISSSQRSLPDNTQHLQQTNIHAPGGIRTHDLSRLAAADLRLRPRGHWDPAITRYGTLKIASTRTVRTTDSATMYWGIKYLMMRHETSNM